MAVCSVLKQMPRNFDLLIPLLLIGHHDTNVYMAQPEEELPYLEI